MNKRWRTLAFVLVSVAAGFGISYSWSTSQTTFKCLDNGKTYEIRSRGYPVQFMHDAADIPACKSYTSHNCFNGTCKSYKGLKRAAEIKPVPLVLDVAIWSVAAAGVLYIISALVIRKR